jgi:hypothetical protein
MVNDTYTSAAGGSVFPQEQRLTSRVLEVAATLLSLGTNKLVRAGLPWLKRKGLAHYFVPALLVNEAFGAYRAYLAMGMTGWW